MCVGPNTEHGNRRVQSSIREWKEKGEEEYNHLDYTTPGSWPGSWPEPPCSKDLRKKLCRIE